jgi:2-isopropylmalate synthase
VALFEQTYLATDLDVTYHAHHLFEEGDKQGIELEMTVAGTRRKLRGVGSGPIAATVPRWRCRSESTTTKSAR